MLKDNTFIIYIKYAVFCMVLMEASQLRSMDSPDSEESSHQTVTPSRRNDKKIDFLEDYEFLEDEPYRRSSRYDPSSPYDPTVLEGALNSSQKALKFSHEVSREIVSREIIPFLEGARRSSQKVSREIIMPFLGEVYEVSGDIFSLLKKAYRSGIE